MDDRPSDLRLPPTRGRYQPPQRRSWVKRGVWLVAGLLVAAGLGWIIFHNHGQPQRAARFSLNGQAMPVVAATAVKGAMPETLNALGTVTPLATVTVRTQIPGQLVKLGFQEGQEVKQGDFLAQVDPRPYQAALDQLQGQLLRDQAQLDNARKDLARYVRLVQQNSISTQQRDTQDALVHQLEGTVASDKAQVDNAKLNLAYCHITAPVSGRVGLRQVDVGNYVQVSDANGIVVITQLKPISVIFTLPEDDLVTVLKRLNSGAKLPVTAYDRSGTTKLGTGVLSTIDNQIDTSTGTFKLRAQFDNPDEMLFPNQFVNVQLLVDTMADATLVPVAAIQRGAPGTFVYLIKPNNTVAVQKVTIGPGTSEQVAVLSGLSPGDKVVVQGADKLRDGAKVSVPAENGGQGAAPDGQTQSQNASSTGHKGRRRASQ